MSQSSVAIQARQEYEKEKEKEKGRRQNFVEVEATKKAESNVVFIEYKDWYL